MFTKNIKFQNFIGKKNLKINNILKKIVKDKSLFLKYPLLKSLNLNYQYSYKKKKYKIF